VTVRKIVLTLCDGDVSAFESLGFEESDLGILLRDALGEFDRAREPVADYVEGRYPARDYSDDFRTRKLAEVGIRKDVAGMLRRAEVTLVDEPEVKLGGAQLAALKHLAEMERFDAERNARWPLDGTEPGAYGGTCSLRVSTVRVLHRLGLVDFAVKRPGDLWRSKFRLTAAGRRRLAQKDGGRPSGCA
jgi:hypothetical protein